MDLRESEAEAEFRLAARQWLEANKPENPLPSPDSAEAFEANRQWERQMYDAGWAVVSWPAAYGGQDRSLWEWMIFEEEYWAAGLGSRAAQNGIFLLAPTIFDFGTEEQKDLLLPRIAGVDDTWAQGWSEPEAGSDLANLRCRADRDEEAGGWRINGQKTWSTRAPFCDRLFGLFRTDPNADRHRGLSYLLVDLKAKGVTVRPIRKLDDEVGFGEIFFDDVFVPDGDVLGPVNEGWKVAMATTGSERGIILRSPGRFLASARRLAALYDSGEQPAGEVRRSVVHAWAQAQAYRLASMNTVTNIARGGQVGAESSLSKLWWSEMDVHINETALDLLDSSAELMGPWMQGFVTAMSTPIFAGTNEIQRNIVAERLLGLPKS